jgi:hypothetical protein
MRQILASILLVVSLAAATIAPTVALPVAASAACSDAPILGITPWYRGLQEEKDGACLIKSPTDGNLGKFITTIALNILQAGFAIAAYVAVFFIIKGGFSYMTSAGSSDGMANAKKTIMNAVIGLVIVLLSAAIINTIASIL